MNVPLLLAGSLTLVAAAIHGGVGEALVVRKLTPDVLPPSRFGGPASTRTMIRVTWHLTTLAFVTVGCAFLLSGSALDGEAARDVGVLAAAASTGFAALILAGSFARGPRTLLRHPAGIVFTLVTVLGWVGVA